MLLLVELLAGLLAVWSVALSVEQRWASLVVRSVQLLVLLLVALSVRLLVV